MHGYIPNARVLAAKVSSALPKHTQSLITCPVHGIMIQS